ncbi:MAG: hypothetical protein CM1200mP18_11990 [Gammaproteobacteria bacterium]|nr:MAG: hypothetical protein CM1200mP18_11990 [Gammaproteobacteria bacterium]
MVKQTRMGPVEFLRRYCRLIGTLIQRSNYLVPTPKCSPQRPRGTRKLVLKLKWKCSIWALVCKQLARAYHSRHVQVCLGIPWGAGADPATMRGWSDTTPGVFWSGFGKACPDAMVAQAMFLGGNVGSVWKTISIWKKVFLRVTVSWSKRQFG